MSVTIAFIVLALLWPVVIPYLGSDVRGWDPRQLGGAISASAATVVAGWGLLQALAARHQVTELQRQNVLLELQVDAERGASQLAYRQISEQRLDEQMPVVSARLREFRLMPLDQYNAQIRQDGEEHDDSRVELNDRMRFIGAAKLQVTNHGSAPVMLRLLPPTLGGFDTQPTGPLGALGDRGMWGDPDARADVEIYSWECDLSGEVLLSRLQEDSGWDGNGEWTLRWQIEVSNLPNTVKDVLTVEGRNFYPFEKTGSADIETWTWCEEIPAEFYGAYGTSERSYVKLEAISHDFDHGTDPWAM